MSELLENLNEAQRAAVINYDCPSLIVAGAGSGKTRVLTSRIAYMLQQGVQPWRILALTFTNKAANEMRERIAKIVSQEQSERLWMGTFHSIFLKILRVEADKLGYPSSFTIYDTSDSRNLIKSIVKEMNLNDEVYKPNAIQSRISLAKNNLVTPAAYEASVGYIAEDRQKKMPEFVEVYKAYARKCRENGAMDFDDLLLNINILFKDFPDTLAKYQERFKYILVDEYQDTNYAQYIIIRRLAEGHFNVCVVGDDAQSIYSFRGAKIENILRFRNDFPAAKIFKLEQNYRSTQTIVNAANSVIERNKNKLDKSLFSAGDKGEKIEVLKAYTDQEEASIVADHIRSTARETEADWDEFALLYRTNMQSRVFEEAFRRRGIPYIIYGGMSFYQRKEIKDMLAYLHLIVNPKDNEAFKRVVNYPARGIGDVTVGRILTLSSDKGKSMFEVAETEDLKVAGLNAGAEKKVKEFTTLIRTLSSDLTTMGLYEFGLEVATKSGIIGGFRMEQTPEAQSALDNIEELLNSMRLYSEEMKVEEQFDQQSGMPVEGVVSEPSLTDWLQNITLLTDMDNDKNGTDKKVTLMTVHAAKGLEYRFVYVVGMEENLFPSLMNMDGGEGLEEERRLFYVALTRAQEKAVLSFSETRFKWGSMEFCRPSRFLSEIDPEYLDIAFDLEAPAENDPTAMLRRNYNDRNRDVKDGSATAGYRGGSYGGGRSSEGYGQGKTICGSMADRYRSAGSVAQQTPQMEKVTVPTPRVGDGTRFRSMGANIKREQEEQTSSPTFYSEGEFKTGQRVSHAKFGTGIITALERMGADNKITVEFDRHGRKTLLSKFAKLSIIE